MEMMSKAALIPEMKLRQVIINTKTQHPIIWANQTQHLNRRRLAEVVFFHNTLHYPHPLYKCKTIGVVKRMKAWIEEMPIKSAMMTKMQLKYTFFHWTISKSLMTTSKTQHPSSHQHAEDASSPKFADHPHLLYNNVLKSKTLHLTKELRVGNLVKAEQMIPPHFLCNRSRVWTM
jgi:hypothetical protein